MTYSNVYVCVRFPVNIISGLTLSSQYHQKPEKPVGMTFIMEGMPPEHELVCKTAHAVSVHVCVLLLLLNSGGVVLSY